MRYRIEHLTAYRYGQAALSTQQTLRLTPRAEPHQRVHAWSVRAPGDLVAATDAYGNRAHAHALHRRHGRLRIEVRGEVEVDALRDGRLDEAGGLPPLVFAAATALTDADEAVAAFAARHLRRRAPAGLFDFALAVREAVAYTRGATDVRTTAAQALALGRGVCQDHAHLFIAGCRALGVPARYVSGYYHTSQAEHAASHAWADAWLPDTGWISIDITHGCFAADALVRLAVGRDYDSACPVRGVRVGGGEEEMEVTVEMHGLDGGAGERRPEHGEEIPA